jgi:hypothetical protein
MTPFTASRRLNCPSRLLRQVGEFESSKSAMNTLAPEFRALMIILRSTGPVISTRRSRKSAAMGAATQSESLIQAVCGRNCGIAPRSISCCRSCRCASSCWRRSSKFRESSLRKLTASGVRILRSASVTGAVI